MSSDRLSQSPPLARILSQAGDRPTVRAACRLALEATALNEDERAAGALTGLSESGPDSHWLEIAGCMREEFDSAAWEAQGRGATDEYDLWFRRARAAAALEYAHADAAGDAVYEAAHAFGEIAAFRVALRAALSL